MMTYFIGATLTFGMLLNAFLKDRSTPKTHVLSWLAILIGTLLWFVTLPFILRKRLLAARATASASAN